MVADTTPIALALYRCCEATKEIPATCTYPLTQNDDVDRESICPAPPRVSYYDVTNNVKGRLDSDLTFVDEYLLHRAEDLEPDVYKRRLQGGFVISYMEPEFGTCGLTSNSAVPNEVIADTSFLLCANIQDSDYYTFNTIEYDISESWLNSTDNCPLLNTSSSMNSTGLGSDSLVDGVSARIVQGGVCPNDLDKLQCIVCPNDPDKLQCSDTCPNDPDKLQCSVCLDDFDKKTRPPAMYTANFTQQKMAATVYYNSEVS